MGLLGKSSLKNFFIVIFLKVSIFIYIIIATSEKTFIRRGQTLCLELYIYLNALLYLKK
jgi:hypothetical protein